MSIFDKKNKVKGNWTKFLKIGDKIEGTLVSKKSVPNQLSGKDQTVYELKVPVKAEVVMDGQKIDIKNEEYWNVGGKVGIDMQMKRVKIGQIVGFEFIEERKAKRPGLNPTKIIQVYADPSTVDKEWIQEQEEINAVEEKEEDHSYPPEAPFEVTTRPKTGSTFSPLSNDELLEQIGALAVEKLGAVTPSDVKIKSMEATNLAFIDANLADILKALQELPANKNK
jgi:hypothetical protein